MKESLLCKISQKWSQEWKTGGSGEQASSFLGNKKEKWITSIGWEIG